MLHPKTDEHVNPSVEGHHLVGKLSTLETLLTEVQRKVCNVCNQGKTLSSPCIFMTVWFAFHYFLQRRGFSSQALVYGDR